MPIQSAGFDVEAVGEADGDLVGERVADDEDMVVDVDLGDDRIVADHLGRPAPGLLRRRPATLPRLDRWSLGYLPEQVEKTAALGLALGEGRRAAGEQQERGGREDHGDGA